MAPRDAASFLANPVHFQHIVHHTNPRNMNGCLCIACCIHCGVSALLPLQQAAMQPSLIDPIA
jgi:hypothetical protein